MSTPRRRINACPNSSVRKSIFDGVCLSPIAFVNCNNALSSNSMTPCSFMSPMQVDEKRAVEQNRILFEMENEIQAQKIATNYCGNDHFKSPGLSNSCVLSLATIDEDQPMNSCMNRDKKQTLSTGRRKTRAKTLFQDTILNGLHMSPTAFVYRETPSNNSESTPRHFHWSIEHLSFINPVEIDETKVFEQSSSIHETVNNAKIQQVASNFFRSCHFRSPAC